MSDISLLKKVEEFDKPWCYQYQRKLDTLEEDKKELGWTDEDIENIDINDFEFRYIDSKEEKIRCKEFIEKYEWMGKLSQFNTHYFQALYKGHLACVNIFNMPNAFSKMLGEDTKNIERLISRGAAASWCPKNLNSKFLMWCMKWMVQNTQYRLFTCYSDPTCGESGIIYQSLGFYLVQKNARTTIRCVNPFNDNVLISDRAFRSRSYYKKYAKLLGIEWQPNWNTDQSILWENIPEDIEKQLRDKSKEMYKNAKKITFPPKLKWAYVLGKDKKETRELRKKFEEMNKIYSYDEAKKFREDFINRQKEKWQKD